MRRRVTISKEAFSRTSGWSSQPPNRKSFIPHANRQSSLLHPPTQSFWITSKRVDAFFAAFGAAGSLALLQVINDAFDFPVAGSFLISSAIRFFFHRNPPDLTAFAQCSAFAIPCGIIMHLMRELIGSHANFVALFVGVMHSKLSGILWPASSYIMLYIAVGSGDWDSSLRGFPVKHVVAPYVTGHLVLYGLARMLSVLRNHFWSILVQREFFAAETSHLSGLSKGERMFKLRELFNRMNCSGDGRLDAYEFQSAIRKATGHDLSLEEATAILKSADTTGVGSLNFNDFCSCIENLIAYSHCTQ